MIAVWISLMAFIAFGCAIVLGWLGARWALRALPAPTSFAEGQRLLYGWLGAAAGMYCGTMATCMIALLMWGGWSKTEEHTIVVIFGWTLGGFIAAMASVMIGLLVGGPVGRFKGSVSKDGLDIEADGSGVAASSTTTTTVVAPGAMASVANGQGDSQ